VTGSASGSRDLSCGDRLKGLNRSSSSENHRLDISAPCSDLLFFTVQFLFSAVLIFRFLLSSHGIICFADVVCSVAIEVSWCPRFQRITMSSIFSAL